MTILFSSSLVNLVAQRGLLETFGLGGGFGTTSTNTSISIYSGAQPLASDVVTGWSPYTSASPDFLLHFMNARWGRPTSTSPFISLGVFPGPATAVHDGAGTWAIIWTSAITAANVAGATLPSGTFIVVPVSDLVGNGVIKFNPNAFTTGTPYSIAEGVLGVAAI